MAARSSVQTSIEITAGSVREENGIPMGKATKTIIAAAVVAVPAAVVAVPAAVVAVTAAVMALATGGCGDSPDTTSKPAAGKTAAPPPRPGEDTMKTQMEILRKQGALSKVRGMPKNQ
jgi:hypothetical protein